MTIDHIGAFFLKDNEILRIIGRVAFPLYAFFISQGYKYTRKLETYALNLLSLAVLIHIPSFFGVGVGAYNVIFTLFFGLMAIILLDKPFQKEIKIIGLIVIFMLFWIFPFEYGLYGILTVVMFHYFQNFKLIVAHIAINIIFFFAFQPFQMPIMQIYSVISSLLICYAHFLPEVKVNKMFYWLFYPVHLFIFYFISIMI